MCYRPIASLAYEQLANYKLMGNGDEWTQCYINILLLDTNATNNYFNWVEPTAMNNIKSHG